MSVRILASWRDLVSLHESAGKDCIIICVGSVNHIALAHQSDMIGTIRLAVASNGKSERKGGRKIFGRSERDVERKG